MRQKYNTRRKISSYKKELKKITDAGFKPIGVAQMFFEDVFVFETQQQATKAYNTLELGRKDDRVVGYWYGKKAFLNAVEAYEKQSCWEYKVRIFWL